MTADIYKSFRKELEKLAFRSGMNTFTPGRQLSRSRATGKALNNVVRKGEAPRPPGF